MPAWRWVRTRTNAEEQVEEAIQQRQAEDRTRAEAREATHDETPGQLKAQA